MTVAGSLFGASLMFSPNGQDDDNADLMSITDFGTMHYAGHPISFSPMPYLEMHGPLDFAESSLTVCWEGLVGEVNHSFWVFLKNTYQGRFSFFKNLIKT